MKLFSKQVVITVALSAIALVIFNLGRDVVGSPQQADFEDWYTLAVPSIEATQPGSAAVADIRVTVAVGGTRHNQWTVPATSLADSEERSRLVRVLQLLKESQVFGLRSLNQAESSAETVSITVTDKEKAFRTIIPLEATTRNIQLKNLLALLDVFAATPASTQVEPGRL